MTPRPGGRFGRYDILKLIGEGGMGAAWLARDPVMGRTVALKCLTWGQDELARERFLREVRAAARLDHPGIVRVFDFGREAGQPYYTMELVEGESLETLIDREKRLAPRRAADIVRLTAEALAYAHARGVIHRDIKPANILLDGNGTPKLTDFGLARELDEHTAKLTQVGDILGTPAYMAPEQAQGRTDLVDARSDVYSLGCVLYRLLAGREPFAADTVLKLLKKVIDEDPLNPHRLAPDTPTDLAAICLRAMEKLPRHRYTTAAEFAADLGRLLEGKAVRARPIGPTRRFARYVLRNRARVAALAVIVLACAALVGYMANDMRYRDQVFTLREQDGLPASADVDYSLRFLLKAARDADAQTRACAVAALSRQATGEARAAILAAAEDADTGVRMRAAEASGRLPRDTARTLLLRLCTDKESFVRAKALNQATSLRLAGLSEAAREGMLAADPIVRGAARRLLLATMPLPSLQKELAAYLAARRTPAVLKAETLALMTRGILPPLLDDAPAHLADGDAAVRAETARLLERCTGQTFGANRAAWEHWLAQQRPPLRTVCAGRIAAASSPLEAGDVIIAIDGRPTSFCDFAVLPAGGLTVVRGGEPREIKVNQQLGGLSLVVEHIVLRGDAAVSSGEIETVLASGKPAAAPDKAGQPF